jgi:hypothetical protein
MKPERGPRALPIESATRPYWLCDAYLKRLLRLKVLTQRRDRVWAYGELQLRKRYRDAHR